MTSNRTDNDIPTRTIIIWSVIGGGIIFGIRILVESLWPAQAELPAAALYIPLQGMAAVVALGIGAVRARKLQQPRVAWSLLFLALVIIGCVAFALYGFLTR